MILTEMGANKINVVKAVRDLVPGRSLKEAMDLVESAPEPVKKFVSKAEAVSAVVKLKDAGATAEVKKSDMVL